MFTKIIIWVLSISLLSILIIFLSLVEIQSVDINFIHVLWINLIFISNIFFASVPFILVALFIFLILTRKWAFRVEKLNIGGFNVLFDNPNQLFIRQIKTFLDTKRTVFKVDFEHDNFCETLDSYFAIYGFVRDEIKILGNIAKKKKNKINKRNQTERLYYLANEMIKELNTFLTKHQNNYRRWYKYMEKSDEKNFYLEPIGELQKNYGNYNELCNDFELLNNFFVEKVAEEFDIDIEKWGN